jgi:SAM-dependent methyltransferase
LFEGCEHEARTDHSGADEEVAMQQLGAMERLRLHYDSKYASADWRTVKPIPVMRNPVYRTENLVAIAARLSGGSYLEIGAGNGETILSLLDYYEHLVGTELSPVRARQLQLLFAQNPKVEILVNNVEQGGLPFPDSTFDAVAIVAVIEHTVEPIGVMREIHRVLKPGGRAIVDTPNIAKWTRRLKLLAGYFPSTASLREGLINYDLKNPTELHDEGHLHYFTFRSFSRIACERAGFERVEFRGYGKTLLHRVWPEMFSELCVVLHKRVS